MRQRDTHKNTPKESINIRRNNNHFKASQNEAGKTSLLRQHIHAHTHTHTYTHTLSTPHTTTPRHPPLHHLHTPPHTTTHLHTPLHHLHTPLHHLHTPPHTT